MVNRQSEFNLLERLSILKFYCLHETDPNLIILDQTETNKAPQGATNTYFSKNNMQSNAGNVYGRRVSTLSNSSYSTETIVSPDYLLNSPNTGLFKRKRKLMDQNNKASDQFIQRINKHDEKRVSKQNSRVSESTEDDSDERSTACSMSNKKSEQLLNKSGSLSSKSSTCSTSSSTSSSSLSFSSSESSLNMSDVCSKSLIFAPKVIYTYKERLFRKSLSEKKSKDKADKNRANIHHIFSPRYIPKTKKPTTALKDSTQTPGSKTNIVEASIYTDSFIAAQNDTPLAVRPSVNPSKVLDEIIDNQTKSNGRLNKSVSNDSSLDSSKLNGSNLRRRKLFDPRTHDIDQAFDSNHQVC